MKSICVYCGSSPGERPDYKAGAIALGNEMVKRGLTLVYGGGNVGLMGIVADAVLHGGNPVIGIIPKSLVRKEVGHKELTELHIVDSMHQRKQMMADRADAFIAMPGGVGTYEELFETFTWLQLGYHNKPIGLLNISGYFDPLVQLVDLAISTGFCRDEHRRLFIVDDQPERLLQRLALHQPPTVGKWIHSREQT